MFIFTAIVEVTELAREGIEIRQKNAALRDPSKEEETELVEARAVGITMCKQLEESLRQITAPETQLADDQFALEK